MKPDERIVWEGEFNESVTTYWLLNGIIICVVTIIGIPVLPIWIIVGKILTGKYLESCSCTLTDRSLKVKKGIFTQIEKTVPLDRITDVGIVEGPIMRYLKINSLAVETAGQSQVGSLHLTGLKNGREFRDAVLKQRDLVVGSNESSAPAAVSSGDTVESGEAIQLLREIRDSLKRLEEK